MDLNEFSKPITAQVLNERAARQFGHKLDIDRFSDAQLYDVRNKLRTECSQYEIQESFDSLPNNQKYNRTRALLDVVNEAIFEREMTAGEKAKEKQIKKKVDKSGMKKSMIKQYGPDRGKEVYFRTIRKRAMAEAVPQTWIESAIERIDLKESTRQELKAELKSRYDLTESRASWVLAEGEEMKADIIIASKDMVGRITGWLEDVAELKAEQLLELLDTIKAEYSADTAQQFESVVKTALETLYTQMEAVRIELSKGLDIVSGREIQTMGEEPQEPGMEISGEEIPAIPSPEEEMEPEMPAAPSGREKRESIEYSRRLGQILSSKKN